jgi:uncharacterized cupredoxin-like copper-binding protein
MTALTRRRALQYTVASAAGLALVEGRFADIAAHDATPAAGSYPVVAIEAKDYAFDVPASFAGGWTQIDFTNHGGTTHHALFMKLNDGVTQDAFKEAAMGTADFGALFGLSVCVGGGASIDPGVTATAILNLDPGQYTVICVIPDDATGMAHYQMGMLAPIEVTPAAAELTAPTAELTIDLKEFMFENLPSELKTGSHTWEVTDTGEQVHEMGLVQLAPGVTFEMVQAMLSAPPASTPEGGMDASPSPETSPVAGSSPEAGGPPFFVVAGAAPMSPAQTNYIVFDLPAGDYFAICFVPDQKTGAPHFALGMVQPFSVK